MKGEEEEEKEIKEKVIAISSRSAKLLIPWV